MRAMKDSGIPWIGEIPERWEVTKMSAYFNEHKSKNINLQESNVLSLSYGKIIQRDVTTNYGLLPSNFNTYNIVNKGDIVFRLTDLQNDQRSLRTGIVMHSAGIITSAYVALRAKRALCNKFYYYLFHSYDVCKVFYQLGQGVRQNLNFGQLVSLRIIQPSQSEQQVVANYLDRKTQQIDATVEREKQHIEKLKQYRQSLISETVTKGLEPSVPMRDSGIPWIGEIPEGWEVRKLRHFASMQNGISAPADFFQSGTPFVNYSDVYNNALLPHDVTGVASATVSQQDFYSVKEGDVFFTRTSETIEELAIASVCAQTIPQAVFSGFLIRARLNRCIIEPLYSKYYFRSSGVREHFIQQSNLVTRASLNQDLLKNLPVALPPLPEQRAIADYLDRKTAQIDAVLAKKETLITKLLEYKKSLIYEAVTGKLDIAIKD